MPDLAAVLDMPHATLHTWVHRGWVQGRRDDTPQRAWILHVDPDELDRLRERRQRPNGYNRHRFLTNQTMTPSTEEGEGHDNRPTA